MAWIRINTRNHTKEKPYLINSYFLFFKIGKAKKSIGWAKYMYVCEWDMCWRKFCNFPLVTKNVKSRSKIALFSNERHFEIWIPKKKTTFFWSKLSKLHKKDPILHVTPPLSLKQGETRTSHGPIPHPLRLVISSYTCYWTLFYYSCNSDYHRCSCSVPHEWKGLTLSLSQSNLCVTFH